MLYENIDCRYLVTVVGKKVGPSAWGQKVGQDSDQVAKAWNWRGISESLNNQAERY